MLTGLEIMPCLIKADTLPNVATVAVVADELHRFPGRAYADRNPDIWPRNCLFDF